MEVFFVGAMILAIFKGLFGAVLGSDTRKQTKKHYDDGAWFHDHHKHF